MQHDIKGIHHITAIAGDAQRNYDFYTGLLGLRLVKKTVNFDDPGTYHFYYGNETGSPGTILTFFPWKGVKKGMTGTGMATAINYSIPAISTAFWLDRFENFQVKHKPVQERFGEEYIQFQDPDGLILNLVASANADARKPWTIAGISADYATRGFQGVELTVRQLDETARVLTDILGYQQIAQEGNRYRFNTDSIDAANIVDVIEEPAGHPGINAGGTNHHVAFRVKDEEILMKMREKVLSAGLHITEKIDRNYFYSLYFREPGGVLFEIATDNPGFLVDEDVSELGKNLKLPLQYEASRSKIEQILPALKQ